MEFYYAVQKGRNRGVYSSWKECKKQVDGYFGPRFRKFKNYEDARKFAFPELYPLEEIKKDEKENDFKSDQQKAMELKDNFIKMQQYVESRKDELLSIPSSQIPEKIINVWITGSKSMHGIIGVYFGENDKRNHVGLYLHKGFVSIARLRLAACIKAIIIVKDEAPCTLVVHTENNYFTQTIIRWTKEWYSRGKDRAWAKSAEVNYDLLEQISKLCLELQVKILPVFCKKNDNNIQKISLLVSEYTP